MNKTRFGLHLPSSIDVPFNEIFSYAKKCEEAGLDSVWVADHITGGSMGGLYEPLSLLAGLAAGTKRVRLGTSILLAALRNPVLLADITGTIQRISGNRLVLGVGVGWDKDEFENLGVDYDRRGAITDEELKMVGKLWKGEKLTYRGKHFRTRAATIAAPAERAPPVWIGGNSTPAIRRATRYDAWFPTDPTVAEIEKGRVLLKEIVGSKIPLIAAHIYLVMEETRRDADRSAKFLSKMTGEPIEKVREWAIVGDPGEVRRRLEEYAKAGTEYFVFSLPRTQDLHRRIKSMANEVAATF